MIYLLRHGKDDENYVGGWSITDLTDEGKKQIELISKYIKENLNITSIYSSDIKRVKTSSLIVSKELNLNPIFTDKLRELNKGDLTGLNIKDALEKYPEYFNEINIFTRYPNGESMMDLYIRMKILLNIILQYEKSLFITHRGVINMFYFILNNELPTMNKNTFNVEYASLHEINILTKKIRRVL